MADIQKGFTFSGSSPNNVATAANLNNLADAATILTSFYTGKPEITSADSGDYALLWDADLNAYRKISIANLLPSAVSRTGFKNLQAANVVGNETTQIVVTADEIVMRSSGGIPHYVSTFNQTLDVTVYAAGSTANGRDFTPLANGTWYYVWAISNGTADRLLFSTSASSPVLPSGYVYQCLLGSWGTLNTATTLKTQFQRDMMVCIPWPSDGSNGAANANNPYLGVTEFSNAAVNAVTGTWSIVDLSRCIPPIASSVQGVLGRSSGSTSADAVFKVASDSGYLCGEQLLYATRDSGTTTVRGFRVAIPFSVPIETTQQIVCADMTTNAASKSMRISSYTLNL